MIPGFNPDPENAFKAMEKLKEAFNRAADANTGRAQPLFEKLADNFTKIIDDSIDLAEKSGGRPPSPKELQEKLMPAIMSVQSSLQKIAREAQSNPAAAAALMQLQKDMQEAMKLMMGKGPSNGNGGAVKPSKPNPPGPNGPKKSPPKKGGDLDF